MDIDWNMPVVQGMVTNFTNEHAQRVDSIAQKYTGSKFATTFHPAFPDQPIARIMTPYDGVLAEYGTSEIQPDPWGLTTLMEAAGG